MRAALAWAVVVFGSGTAAADEESEYDPIDGLGKCTSIDVAGAAELRRVIAATTAMVTVCYECDDLTPRRRDVRTLAIEPFNGGTLHTIRFDGAAIDLAQTFVKVDLDGHGRSYTSAPFKNLALLVGCPVYGPVLRGLRLEDAPAPTTPTPTTPTPTLTTSSTAAISGALVDRPRSRAALMLALIGLGVIGFGMRRVVALQ